MTTQPKSVSKQPAPVAGRPNSTVEYRAPIVIGSEVVTLEDMRRSYTGRYTLILELLLQLEQTAAQVSMHNRDAAEALANVSNIRHAAEATYAEIDALSQHVIKAIGDGQAQTTAIIGQLRESMSTLNGLAESVLSLHKLKDVPDQLIDALMHPETGMVSMLNSDLRHALFGDPNPGHYLSEDGQARPQLPGLVTELRDQLDDVAGSVASRLLDEDGAVVTTATSLKSATDTTRGELLDAKTGIVSTVRYRLLNDKTGVVAEVRGQLLGDKGVMADVKADAEVLKASLAAADGITSRLLRAPLKLAGLFVVTYFIGAITGPMLSHLIAK